VEARHVQNFPSQDRFRLVRSNEFGKPDTTVARLGSRLFGDELVNNVAIVVQQEPPHPGLLGLLRERVQDILPLTEFFVAKFAACLNKPIDLIPMKCEHILERLKQTDSLIAGEDGAAHIPVLGFGTLIPDAAATISATRDALDEINRLQTRQRFNEVVKTGSPGFHSTR